VARHAGRPYLEIEGLAHSAMIAKMRSLRLAVERSTQAIELARQHGLDEEPVAAFAYTTLGITKSCQGQLEEAARWLDQAEQVIRPEIQPVTAMLLHTSRGTLELARGRATDALAAYRTAERLAELVVPRHMVTTWMTAGQLHARLRLGETRQVDAVLAGLDGEQRETGVMRIVLATLRLARGDPQAASDALAAVLDGSVPHAAGLQRDGAGFPAGGDRP